MYHENCSILTTSFLDEKKKTSEKDYITSKFTYFLEPIQIYEMVK